MGSYSLMNLCEYTPIYVYLIFTRDPKLLKTKRETWKKTRKRNVKFWNTEQEFYHFWNREMDKTPAKFAKSFAKQ